MGKVNTDDAINLLLKENIELKAELNVLNGIFFSYVKIKDPEFYDVLKGQFSELYLKQKQSLLASHPFLSDDWGSLLGELNE